MGPFSRYTVLGERCVVSLLLSVLLSLAWSTTVHADGGTVGNPAPFEIGMAMIGGSVPDGGDDVGPANEVQDMVEHDLPVVTFSGMPSIAWKEAQPNDPGAGPDVYDWSALDAKADKIIPGKGLRAYQQIWGTYPDWVELDTARFWEKYEAFITAMTVHINENWGTVYYVFENEPNISRAPDGWNWADWYIHCLEHFYPAVHAANPITGYDNKVIAGNLSGHAAGGFNDLYARGLKDCSDILGYHPYPYDITDGLEVSDLAQIHATQVTYGDEAKKIFVSEGWGSGRSAGFDRSSPLIPPPAQEIENMFLAMVNGYDNVMTAQTNWSSQYLWGMSFFCGNDNWGAMNWRKRAIPIKNAHGDITGFIVDGYQMTTDIAPYFWNGGMLDFYGNSKDCLLHVFPGHGLVFMNPGFELASEPPDAHLPHFWSTLDGTSSPTNFQLDTTIYRGGSQSLRLSQSAPGEKGVSQTTVKRSAAPGTTYRARVWARTQAGTGTSARFYLRFRNLNGDAVSGQFWADPVSGTSEWQQMEVTATAPSSTGRCEVVCLVNGPGIAWFDDVTISEASRAEVGTVRGYTLDEGQIPVPNCIVRTTTGGAQAVSDANGYYEIADVPTGTYDFVCRKPGYVPCRVGNQTVAAGKLTFVSFNMGIPTPGLAITSIDCEQGITPVNGTAEVTVIVENAQPYANQIAEVSLFIEQGGSDVSEQFVVQADPSNPVTIPAGGQASFAFSVVPRVEAEGGTFEINAYAFGQEDRPNLLQNSGFDDVPWDNHYSFSGGAGTLDWAGDTSTYYSVPRSLRCYVADSDYSWNWANNWSAYGPSAPEAHPARNYTVGVYHKDSAPDIAMDLFIQEYYFDGGDWFYNGRRFAAVPHRSVWAHDVMIYKTGDPNETAGLYTTNRLVISCGPCTSPGSTSGYCWWDDLYVKETGDWLADDRGDEPAVISVGPPHSRADFDYDFDVDIADFGHLQVCFSGPGVPQNDPDCRDARLDVDEDVDWDDFAMLQGCLSGSGVPAVATCAD
jgi:hypothetical protein